MEKLPINDWVKELKAIERSRFTLENVFGYLMSHGVTAQTLSPYLHWSSGSYTRNLIYKSDLFEVIAICWESGHVSQIHNHRDQNCWMAVPIGRLLVQNFRVEILDKKQGLCRLEPADSYVMDAQHPAAVSPHAPVHQVLNPATFGNRAVSVHIYSFPFDTCEVYSMERGTYYDVPLHYTSEYGKVNLEEGRA